MARPLSPYDLKEYQREHYCVRLLRPPLTLHRFYDHHRGELRFRRRGEFYVYSNVDAEGVTGLFCIDFTQHGDTWVVA